jgi:hypothetical protein
VSNSPPQSNPISIDVIYARLNQRDIEQFYAGYQRWTLQQQISTLEAQLDALRGQIADNTERMQEVHTSAIALATLVRLQSNGVNDIDLLDRMLERGEMWLDRTMQQLDYCEQLDGFICDDYTQWCKHALEGAYDWIDSIQDGNLSSSTPVAVTGDEQLIEATEELLLQKFSSDEDEDEASMLEATLKRPAITIAQSEEPASMIEDNPSTIEAVSVDEEAASVSKEETLAANDTAAPDLPTEQVGTHEQVETEFTQTTEEPGPGEDLTSYEQITNNELTDVEQTDLQESVVAEETLSVENTSNSEGEPTASVDYASSEEHLSLEESATPETEIAASTSEVKDEVDTQPSIPEQQGRQPQSWKPKQPNLIVRLIMKIMGI